MCPQDASFSLLDLSEHVVSPSKTTKHLHKSFDIELSGQIDRIVRMLQQRHSDHDDRAPCAVYGTKQERLHGGRFEIRINPVAGAIIADE